MQTNVNPIEHGDNNSHTSLGMKDKIPCESCHKVVDVLYESHGKMLCAGCNPVVEKMPYNPFLQRRKIKGIYHQYVPFVGWVSENEPSAIRCTICNRILHPFNDKARCAIHAEAI